jgi:hypothetical protein
MQRGALCLVQAKQKETLCFLCGIITAGRSVCFLILVMLHYYSGTFSVFSDFGDAAQDAALIESETQTTASVISTECDDGEAAWFVLDITDKSLQFCKSLDTLTTWISDIPEDERHGVTIVHGVEI